MDKNDCGKLERYLRRLFNNSSIRVTPRPRKNDSAEFFVGEEFVGIISEDKEDGERSFNLDVAILDIDLEGV